MSNPLTGDFEAVLQVSGGTINRLLATLHQNSLAGLNLPSFPHVAQIRIGDGRAVTGVRGAAYVQVSVPRVTLIHGVTDRFDLQVSVRAWFIPDPGTTPLPAFIHGTVSARYRLDDIDPKCLGWKHAADQFWFRVIQDSVRFDGTADEDVKPRDAAVIVSLTGLAAADAANTAKITKQIASLLATRFEASPHPVKFGRGSMRSLSIPLAGSAVSIAIGITGGPVGDVASMQNVVLDGADMSIAVSVDYFMSVVNQALGPIRSFNQTVPIHIDTGDFNPIPNIDTVYRVSVAEPGVEWQPHDTFAIIRIKVSGSARTDSVLADATFDITQEIVLSFDADVSRIVAAPGAHDVKVHSSGLFSGTVADVVKNAIAAALPPKAQSACQQAQPQLDSSMSRVTQLTMQLRTLDRSALVTLVQARFLRDGIILKGTIALSARQGPSIKIEKTADSNALNALQCWIPGGRIDRFEWTWSWSGAGEPGKAVREDRFLLRRPAAKSGRWGLGIGMKTPLPGLDGYGKVCLKISGARVDSQTGELVPFESAVQCTRFGFAFSDHISTRDRLFLLDVPELSEPVPFPQLALVGASRASNATTRANILLSYVDELWNAEIASTLEGGLNACSRYDAGLSVLVLFREGMLERSGGRAMSEIAALGRKLGIAMAVNEDVHGGWSRAFGFRSGSVQSAWAIVSPDGAALWTHHGQIPIERLATALDRHLRTVADAAPLASAVKTEVGSVVDRRIFDLGVSVEPEVAHCPPPPFGTRGAGSTVVTFVQAKSLASAAELRRLVARHEHLDEESRPNLFAIVDRAGPRDADPLKAAVQANLDVMPDATGVIADRFGIEVWPTTITIDRNGRVSEVTVGSSVPSHYAATS